jgi:hypothetical protein
MRSAANRFASGSWWEPEVVLVLSTYWGHALARRGGAVLNGGCHAVVGCCT